MRHAFMQVSLQQKAIVYLSFVNYTPISLFFWKPIKPTITAGWIDPTLYSIKLSFEKTNITSMSYSHNMLVIIRHTKNKSEHNRWRIALSHALAHGRPAAHWSQFSLPSQVLRNLSDCIFHILGETHLDAVRPNDMTCESCVIYLWYTCCYVTIRYLYLI